jgi:hypothetical protein
VTAGGKITAAIQVPLQPGLAIEPDEDTISRSRVET